MAQQLNMKEYSVLEFLAQKLTITCSILYQIKNMAASGAYHKVASRSRSWFSGRDSWGAGVARVPPEFGVQKKGKA